MHSDEVTKSVGVQQRGTRKLKRRVYSSKVSLNRHDYSCTIMKNRARTMFGTLINMINYRSMDFAYMAA